jgi:hypothetical protein
LDTVAAGRFLAAGGIGEARIWVASDLPATDDAQSIVRRAWSAGIAVVRVTGSVARDAALATAEAAGIDAQDDQPRDEGQPATLDGARLASRFEFGLWPDETVELVLGEAAMTGLADRLTAFDEVLTNAKTPQRLILAGLSDHGPRLEPELVSAIVHPQVLVELVPSPAGMIEALRHAADRMAGDASGG